MSIRLIGANPFLLLYEQEKPSGYASVWRVDWSEQGSGNAMIVWLPTGMRVIGSDLRLAQWLAEEFNQHFPEFRELAWQQPQATAARVDLELDLMTGMRATGADVVVEIPGPPLDRRLIEVDHFDVGGQPHRLRAVLMPCASGRLIVEGRSVPGIPQVVIREEGVFSSAVLADAEVWATQTGREARHHRESLLDTDTQVPPVRARQPSVARTSP